MMNQRNEMGPFGDMIPYEPIEPPKRNKLQLHVYWSWDFFAISPALNINIGTRTLEFEWLFLGIYLDYRP